MTIVTAMGTAVDRLPSLTLDDASVPRQHQFERFRDAIAPVFDARQLVPDPTAPTHVTDYMVDGLIVSRLTYTGQVLRRAARHLRVGDDCVSVLMHVRGGMSGVIGEQANFALDAEHIGIIDLASPFATCCDESDVIWMLVPRRRLTRARNARRAPITRLHRASPRGRVLAASIEQLWDDLTTAPAGRGPELATRIVDAIETALRPGDHAPDDASLRVAMNRYIATNLEDLDLDHDTLRSTFFCSRSTLYRLFKPDGGVAAYIRSQRLLRCFDELTAADAPPSVADVATRWGFENPSHFNRLFKAAFGRPPSSVVDRRGGLVASDGSIAAMSSSAAFPAWLADF